ncbi:hypothetical protein SRB5_18160 [Streptomyces sp. RB5]|uniref:Uncharacterized protein n=1 Tax=Streptomyces smaragdinus TaxID=2585196 RepID=A0A7K0CDZ4_9ACTN|nr:hypothetical protein [Streptomyces smaragdinus]MQY11697.1 hypothetical protein [Streptomyces smaragdinus]
MAETEFAARGVRIGRWLRSMTRAGQVRIRDGRLELLTSLGQEIDSAPVQNVRAGRPWFLRPGRALASVNGTHYLLTLGGGGSPHFLEAVRTARTRAAKARDWG